jgi:hypothetical protein
LRAQCGGPARRPAVAAELDRAFQRKRRECPEISWGSFTVLRTNVPQVFAIRYDWRQTSLVTLHNFVNRRQKLTGSSPRDDVLVDVFSDRHSRRHADALHHITLEEYGWRWYRVGAAGSQRPSARSGGSADIARSRVL